MSSLELASNPNTSPETLAVLATDEVAVVRFGVARNPNTSPETLAVLATDNVNFVRNMVSYNPNATEEILLTIKAYEKYGHLANCHTRST